jgi:hypothetical protein
VKLVCNSRATTSGADCFDFSITIRSISSSSSKKSETYKNASRSSPTPTTPTAFRAKPLHATFINIADDAGVFFVAAFDINSETRPSSRWQSFFRVR